MPVTIEVLGINEVLDHLTVMQWSLSQSSRKIVQEVAKIAKGAVQDEAPVGKTGDLRRGIKYRTFGATGGHEAYARFYVDDPASNYVLFVLEGTAPHDIYPSAKKALFWPGAAHPVAFVHHPGTKPNDFVGRAMDEIEGAADRVLNGVGDDIVNGVRIEAGA